jgi:predicted Zn-dependent protease
MNLAQGRPMKRIYSTVAIASLALSLHLLGACATTTAGGAVGADRSQLLLVSSEQLDQMAAESYTKLQSDASCEGVLNEDPAMLKRVRNIAGRLEAQTKVFRADAPAWNWEVNVITSDELNAFCMPGGKIMVYSAIITQLDLTDAAGMGYQALLATRFSRTDESEADRIGLELAARAGYDPRAGITLWQKMTSANKGGKPPEFLSSHPADASRVKQIEELLPSVMPLYVATN